MIKLENLKNIKENPWNQEVLEALDNFPIEHFDCEMEFKTENMVVLLNELYKRTKDELSGTFTLNEAWTIISAFNSFQYTPQLDDKKVLITEVESSINFEGINELYGADKDKLLKKLEKLTQAQSFTVIRMAIEFWCFNIKHPLSQENSEVVKKIFKIK